MVGSVWLGPLGRAVDDRGRKARRHLSLQKIHDAAELQREHSGSVFAAAAKKKSLKAKCEQLESLRRKFLSLLYRVEVGLDAVGKTPAPLERGV